jgi:hypothetical protein
MHGLQRVGGGFALLQGALFVLLLVYQIVLRPALGLGGPGDPLDPAKALPAAAASPLFGVLFLLQIGFAATTLVTVLALEARLRAGAPDPMRVATAAGLGAAVLFLAAGMTGFVGVPLLAGLYPQNPAGAGAAYLAGDAVGSGLVAGAIFAAGWWALLASWAARRTAALPGPLAYLGLLFGAASILAFLVPPLMLLGAITGLIWSLWLGAVLVRVPPERAATAAAPA